METIMKFLLKASPAALAAAVGLYTIKTIKDLSTKC